jgi:glycosyltransferase involved in cell wall biosynthesis
VAPNQENIREILLDGQTAMLFCSGDKVAFKKAVFRLAADKAMRMRLGERARVDIIARHYTWIDNAERVCALYNHESMA